MLDGYKYDLRVYAVVTSYEPLRIYVYPEGLTRICTEKYNVKSRGHKGKFAHLTNFSINKKSDKFLKPSKDGLDDGVTGNKWSFTGLRRKYKEIGVDTKEIFSKIDDIIVKTVIACE